MIIKSYIVLLGPGFLFPTASNTLLNPSFDITLATRSCEVPMLSNVKDWILEMWTPISRWIPEHSMQMMTPKLVDSQVESNQQQMEFNVRKLIVEGIALANQFPN